MKKFVFFLILALFITSCSKSDKEGDIIPQSPDYSDTTYWYSNALTTANQLVDVFYVYPTLGTKPIDDQGNPLFYTNVDKLTERNAAKVNLKFMKDVYAAKDFNFFAPYYRQITLDVYFMEEASMLEKIKIPEADILRAFQYYMAHLNQGRPFILLGHSQGSQVLIELLKTAMTPEQYNQMVAAYLIGFQITEQELATYPDRLKPAQGSSDTGVIILYNSLSDIHAKSPIMSHSAVGINPLNWKTDTTSATKEEHLGILKYNAQTDSYDTIPHFTGAALNAHYLICTDVNPDDCYIEALKALFPRGNLHFMDSWLYCLNIKKNMKTRSDRFLSGRIDD